MSKTLNELSVVSGGSGAQGPAMSSPGLVMMEEGKPETSVAYRQWTYALELCEFMYHDGLLDRQEFLQSLVEITEKYGKYPEDPLMRILLPIILKYIKEFTRSQILSRSGR